jgi:hypothetical protein
MTRSYTGIFKIGDKAAGSATHVQVVEEPISACWPMEVAAFRAIMTCRGGKTGSVNGVGIKVDGHGCGRMMQPSPFAASSPPSCIVKGGAPGATAMRMLGATDRWCRAGACSLSSLDT